MTQFLSIEEKIKKDEELLKETYYKASEIEKLVTVRNPQPNEQDFLKFGRRIYIPKEWYIRKDLYYDIALRRLADNLALSEKKFIIQKILEEEKVNRIILPEINSASFKQNVRTIVENRESPTILLAPIDYFMDLNLNWVRQDRDFRVEKFDKISIQGHSFTLFWSNKYIPFNEFIFLNKNYGEWVAKPSINERFFVKISDSDKPDQMDLQMYTTMKFSINKPEKITVLQKSVPILSQIIK
jgi:hypothetical protein